MVEEEGKSGKTNPKFGLQSPSYSIFKMRRFPKLDHWCPMIKLSRHQVTLNLRGKKDDRNATVCDRSCEWHNQILCSQYLLRAKMVKEFIVII